jgi:acetyl esterase/lipase
VRIHRPEKIEGIYLHIHGGGFVLGAAKYHDEELAGLAMACNVAVVSVDYRLAPEHPYPAGPDDCEAAALWLARESRAAFGVDRIVIGGESAGANLSAATLLRLRDRHGFTGFNGAVLSYGVFDLNMTPSARGWGERPLILTTPLLDWFNNHYAEPENLYNPDISPLYADLKNMPPALFLVGTEDPLLDDTLFMQARWTAAGNRAETAVFPGACHGFNAFPVKAAEDANQRIGEFIVKHLNASHH